MEYFNKHITTVLGTCCFTPSLTPVLCDGGISQAPRPGGPQLSSSSGRCGMGVGVGWQVEKQTLLFQFHTVSLGT